MNQTQQSEPDIYNLSTAPGTGHPKHIFVTMGPATEESLWGIIRRHHDEFAHDTCCIYCMRGFEDGNAIPHSRVDLYAIDRDTGREYEGTDIACADCARRPGEVIERVRVYVSEREQVTFLLCREIHRPFNFDDMRLDMGLN